MHDIKCLHDSFLVNFRAAYHESILLGQELTKKINETPAESTDHLSSGESSDDGKHESIAGKAARKMKKVISGENEVDEELPEESKKYGKLLNMDFMKQAKQRQKERALEEAQGVLRQLRELEQTSTAADDDDEDAKSDRRLTKSKKDLNPSELRAAKSNVDRLLGVGGSSNLMTVTTGAGASTGTIVLSGKYGISSGDQSTSWMNSPAPVESKIKSVAAAASNAEEDRMLSANPWVGQTSNNDPTNKKSKKAGSLAGSKRGMNEFEGKVLIDSSSSSSSAAIALTSATTNASSSSSKVVTKVDTVVTEGNSKKRKITAATSADDGVIPSADASAVGPKPATAAGNARKPLLAQKSQV